MKDIETLLLKCRSTDSKIYIQEAYDCYKSGAYRSSIVACWTAVTFDLILKLRELASSGDAAAKKAVTDFDKINTQMDRRDPNAIVMALKFEREILDEVFKTFKFLDNHQYTDMLRLKEDRNRCAHPAYTKVGLLFQPSAESARMHIVNSLEHILSKPPLHGKSFVDSITSKITSKYFPNDRKMALDQLKDSELANASEALVRALIDNLMLGVTDPASPFYRNRQVRSGLIAIYELKGEIARERICRNFEKLIRNIDDENLLTPLVLLPDHPYIFNHLAVAHTAKITSFLKRDKQDALPKLCGGLIDSGIFIEAAKAKLQSFELNKLTNQLGGMGNEAIFWELFRRFKLSRNWNEANTIWNQSLKDNFEKLNEDRMMEVLNAASIDGVDLDFSAALREFVEACYESDKISNENLESSLTENQLNHLSRNSP